MYLLCFQGSYGIVKLAYNEEDDYNYVSGIFLYKWQLRYNTVHAVW